MIIKGIDHIVLRTDVLDKMLAFYGEVLGCQIERELPELGLVQLRAGATLIDLVPVDGELGRRGGSAPGREGRNLDHLCLLLTQIDEAGLRRHLHDHSIAVDAFAERYGATGYGQSVYIEDPQGNVVELKLDSSDEDRSV